MTSGELKLMLLCNRCNVQHVQCHQHTRQAVTTQHAALNPLYVVKEHDSQGHTALIANMASIMLQPRSTPYRMHLP
jgi:hypothetical protein